MILEPKDLSPYELAHRWAKDLATRPRHEHKSGMIIPRYANVGSGAVCQWHTFGTDRNEVQTREHEMRSNPRVSQETLATKRRNLEENNRELW